MPPRGKKRKSNVLVTDHAGAAAPATEASAKRRTKAIQAIPSLSDLRQQIAQSDFVTLLLEDFNTRLISIALRNGTGQCNAIQTHSYSWTFHCDTVMPANMRNNIDDLAHIFREKGYAVYIDDDYKAFKIEFNLHK